MATIRVTPNPRVLAWAVERAPTELRHKFPRLDKWLSGVEKPTLRQLENFAKAASVLSEPPEEHP